MAKSAYSPTLTFLSSSILFPTSTFISHKRITTSKIRHCQSFPILCKQPRNSYSLLNFSGCRNSQHFLQSAIQVQVNHGIQMLEREPHVTQAESVVDESQLVEVGYICNVFGLHGEVRVHPSTDFPELRFEKPGVRWLKTQRSGTVTIQEFELISGRSHPGKKQWLLSFKGVNSAEKAKELVGATMFVRDDDRPALDEDEYYSRDLVGMSVVLKDTNELVGTVVDIFNTGANDLLSVILSETKDNVTGAKTPAADEENSAPLIWIPFVQDIVPDVDIQMRQLRITPPEGLLELNLRPKGLTSGDRRREEIKQKRKTRQKVAGIKKKLHELGQEHILMGLSTGNETQKQALLDQLSRFDFKLFKHALQEASGTYDRSDLSRHLDTKLTRNLFLGLDHLRKNNLQLGRKEYKNKDILQLRREGLELIVRGQVAVVLLVDEKELQNLDGKNEITVDQMFLQSRAEELLTIQKLANSGSAENSSIPLIIIATEDTIPSLQLNFEDHDYFGLEEEQVWFVTQGSLPCVGSSSDKEEYKILMESSWKIIEAPNGHGNMVRSLLEQGVLERLTGKGIQFICTINELNLVADPVFLGHMHKQGTDVGVKLFAQEFHGQSEQAASTNRMDLKPYSLPYQSGENGYILISEESDAQPQFFTTGFQKENACLDIILSISYLQKLSKKLYQMEHYKEKRHFDCLKEENREIENAYQLRSSIYSLLKFSPSNKVSLILYH
ncbi:uncharacterized protein LOC131051001 isoform X2 [Cryptomeria japonica]|uniref:uncharacterized protein LOC131051001 isoform X2 n=1 Tax=Cryptomeria japonica TaxID=3369 RepID=UPI0027DA25F4|nr:uncharacterized protein LOC131051001 isoform X2 [Cryptomeria japonica]